MGYGDAVAKYALIGREEELAKEIVRKLDFEMLDYEIEEVEPKPSAEQVELILDEFNEALVGSDWYFFAKVDFLRDAIGKVMGRDYLDG